MNNDNFLSILSLLRLIDKHTEYKFLMEKIAKYPMEVSSIFKDWFGIDCKLCVVLLHLTYIHIQTNKPYVPANMNKNTMIAIYNDIWKLYVEACEIQKFKFIPSIKGLETILKKFQENSQKSKTNN
jgi:hypothetical protein